MKDSYPKFHSVLGTSKSKNVLLGLLTVDGSPLTGNGQQL